MPFYSIENHRAGRSHAVAAIAGMSLPVVLAGCVSSATGLSKEAPVAAYSSTAAPERVAACITLALNGPAPYVKDGDGHYVVTRQNGFGRPLVRIDITKDGDGSKIEVRRSVPFNTGLSKIKTCAEA